MISGHHLERFLQLGLTVSTVFLLGCTKNRSDYKNHVVVKVNETGLTAADFSEQLGARLKVFNSLSAKDSAVISQAKNAVVRDFIVHVITQDWAKAKQLFVRKEQLDSEIKKMRGQYPDDIAFRRALAQEGLTYDIWESRLSYSLLEKLVIEDLRKQSKPITPSDLTSYYQKNKSLFQVTAAVRLRQVVSDTDVNAQRIKKELDSGKPLSELAKKFSTTPEGADGGDVGWIEKGVLDVYDAAFKMNVGQRSGIVKSPFGYHIFEVTAKRVAKTLPFDEAKKRVELAVQTDNEQELYSSWLEEQVLRARVFKDDDFLKSITIHTRDL